MIRKILTVCGILLASLLITNSVFADKVDKTVQYNKQNKAFCNKPLQLSYSPSKDVYFCSHNPRNNYVHVDTNGKPYCIKPYRLVFGSKFSKIFKKTPTCTNVKF